METAFIDWLKNKEDLLTDQIENSRASFTTFDNLELEGVKGALRLYIQWLESSGAVTWSANNQDLSDQALTTFKQIEDVNGIRNNQRRTNLRRAIDLSNSAWGPDRH